jgi:hypothetical protein
MKITKVSKFMTYYVSTDASEYPDYRTNETGTHWENLMGDSWEPVYAITKERELQEMFREYMKQNEVEE